MSAPQTSLAATLGAVVLAIAPQVHAQVDTDAPHTSESSAGQADAGTGERASAPLESRGPVRSEATPLAPPAPAETTPAARAIDDLRLGLEDDGLGNAVWLSGGVFGGDVRDDSVIAGTIDLGIRLALTPDARVSLDWGVAIAQTRVRGAYTSPTTVEEFDERHLRVEARNADLQLEWAPFVSADVRVGAGVGVAIPVAATTRLPSSAQTQSLLDASTLVHEAYLAANGGFYAWRYRPERVAVYLPVSLVLALDPDTVLSFEGAAAIGVRVLGNLGPELLGDVVLAADVGTRVVPELRVGGRVSVAGLELGTSTWAVQPAVAAWARVELAPVSLLLRGDVGLGGPYGVGSSFAGWGLHVGASAAL